MRDMREKRRHPHGETHTSAKLTEPNVREIQQLLHVGRESKAALDRDYNVSESLIRAISHGHIWRHMEAR
jgi:hypothetical protein